MKLGENENATRLDVEMVAVPCGHTKKRIVHLKLVNYMMHELYLNKAVKKCTQFRMSSTDIYTLPCVK